MSPQQNGDSKGHYVETDGIVNPEAAECRTPRTGNDAFALGLAALAALALLLEPSKWLTLTADLTLPRC